MRMWLMRAKCNSCDKELFGYEGMKSCPYCDGNHVAKQGMISMMPVDNKDMQVN